MPELPEVHTTVTGLQKNIISLFIHDVWTNYYSLDKRFISQIKNPKYFKWFKKTVVNSKIINVSRRAKNILIELDNGFTILVHMKMTGHFLYGNYKKNKNTLAPVEEGPLKDPFNRFVHFAFSLSNKKHLVLSDMRKFAKISLFETHTIHKTSDLKNLGPEPLSPAFTFKVFQEQILKRKNKPIKTALMDQEIVAGIGNIYSDEILWRAGIHPLSLVCKIKKTSLEKIYKEIKPILKKGIDFRGDSMSDYRNIDGRPGEFQNKHEAYRRAGKKCKKRGCVGIIERKIIGGRSAHFCPKHQKLLV